MRVVLLIAVFFFITSCDSECNDFSIESYINRDICREYYSVNDDDCIKFIEETFFESYGVHSFEYLENLQRGSNEFDNIEIIDKFGAYLLGVSVLYGYHSSVEYLLKAAVNPYAARGTPYAGVVFIIQNKDMSMWSLVREYYPVDKYQDSLKVENFLVKCSGVPSQGTPFIPLSRS